VSMDEDPRAVWSKEAESAPPAASGLEPMSPEPPVPDRPSKRRLPWKRRAGSRSGEPTVREDLEAPRSVPSLRGDESSTPTAARAPIPSPTEAMDEKATVAALSDAPPATPTSASAPKPPAQGIPESAGRESPPVALEPPEPPAEAGGRQRSRRRPSPPVPPPSPPDPSPKVAARTNTRTGHARGGEPPAGGDPAMGRGVSCSRCGEPSERGLCDPCREALNELQGLSGLFGELG
jgi:hypothetical protein